MLKKNSKLEKKKLISGLGPIFQKLDLFYIYM